MVAKNRGYIMSNLPKDQVQAEQQKLLELGYYNGEIDGKWGPQSKAALDAYEQDLILISKLYVPSGSIRVPIDAIAWGKKVSATFKARIKWIAEALEMPKEGVNWLMACMAWESAETFSSDIKNAAGSGATGLIQFMPTTALSLGTTTAKLALLTPEDQLNYVYKYFAPRKGKLNTLSDVYMAILWPAAIGKAENSILWSKEKRPTTYRQNSGLDINKDGLITKAEAAKKVRGKLTKGLTEAYFG